LSLGKAVIMKDHHSSQSNAMIENTSSSSSATSTSAVATYRLEHLLLLENLPIAVVPAEAFQTLMGGGGDVAAVAGEVSPEYVRQHFRIHTSMENHSLSSRGKAYSEYMSHHPALREAQSFEAATAIVSNAAFLLDFCISDLYNNNNGSNGNNNGNNNGYNSSGNFAFHSSHQRGAAPAAPLLGLQLVPMEDRSLGLIGDPTEAAPLFLASENERKLLQKVGQCLIVADSVLGSRVAAYFRHPACAEVYNIRSLTALDALKLLKEIVPDSWFSHSTVLVNRLKGEAHGEQEQEGAEEGAEEEEEDVHVSVEWLQGLWGYILESDSLGLFEGMIPMIPVYQPPFHPPGSYLLKIFPSVPVLHMSFKDLIQDDEAIAALGDLGLHIFDPSTLGAIAYSKELANILCDPTPLGLLQALCAIGGEGAGGGGGGGGGVASKSAGWSPTRRDAMRHLVLDLILAKLEKIPDDAKEVLRSFPIYKRCSGGLNTAPSEPYSALITLKTDGDAFNPGSCQYSLQIPPRSVKENHFFDDNFVSLRSSKDRDLYAMLGLVEPSGGSFYLSSVLPNVAKGVYTSDAMDQLSVNLLVSLNVLEKQQPGLSQMLQTCSFVKNAGGKYCQPSDLFDPHAPYLPSLMPPDAFPCPLLYEKTDIGTILASLRKIGLCTGLTSAGVVRAAVAIQRDRELNRLSAEELQLAADGRGDDVIEDSGVGEPTSINEKHANMQRAVQRSINLMRYLDLNIHELLHTVGDVKNLSTQNNEIIPEEDSIGMASSNGLAGAGAGAGVAAAATASQQQQQQWGQQLRELSWIAAHTRAPSSTCINSIAPPWPHNLHHEPLTKASQCALPQHIWLCSTSSRIPQVDIHSEELKQLLGWGGSSVPGRIAAQQLLALWQFFQKSLTSVTAPTGSPARKKEERQHTLVVEMCYSVIPRVMASLAAALEAEPDMDVDIWCRALKSKPIIWISSAGTFVEPNRVAFTPLYGINAEPSLYVAKGELLTCRSLLLRLGVKESFGVSDLSGLLRELKSRYQGGPLPSDKLDMCVGIINIVVRMLDPSMDEGDSGNDSDHSENEKQLEDISLEKEDESGGGVQLSPASSADALKAKAQRLIEAKASLGKVFLPDSQAVLAEAHALSFDDAPWISSQLAVRGGGGGGGGVRFVHKLIDPDTASLLGAKSLREQLFAGDDIVCPSAASVKDILRSDSISDALGDLVGLSDMVGATATHLLYDERLHPCESLMHPGLAECQGEALVVFIEGVVLESEEIAQLLMSPTLLYQLPSSFASGVALPLNTTSATDEDEINRKEIKYNTYGKRLNAAFAITDCLQILSGCQYFIFDPCGSHLLSSGAAAGADESAKAGGSAQDKATKVPGQQRALSSKAQRCSLTGQNNQDLLSRFPDQFSPLLSLSFSVEGGLSKSSGSGTREHLVRAGQVNGTLIRMPLRFAPSALSSNVFAVEKLRATMNSLLHDCVSWLEGSLVFSRFVQVVTLQHWHEGVNTPRGAEVGGKKAGLKRANAESVQEDKDLVKEYYFMRCTNASAIQAARKKITIDKSWKKAGRSSVSSMLSSFFTQGINPVAEVSLTAQVIHRIGILVEKAPNSIVEREPIPVGHAWLRFQEKDTKGREAAEHEHEMASSWMLTCLQGAPKVRNLALKAPYKPLGILPFISIAAKVMSFEDIDACLTQSTHKMPRHVYCGAGMLTGSTSGLPFHLDGSFLMDMARRGVVGVPAGLSGGAGSVQSNSSQAPQIMSLALLQQWNSSLLTACLDTLVPSMLQQLRDHMLVNNEGGVSSDLKRFYIYWPYLSSMSQDLAFAALHQSTLFPQLSQAELFLGRRDFEILSNVIIPLTPNPSPVRNYRKVLSMLHSYQQLMQCALSVCIYFLCR
jgi:hypothetical protein